MTTIFNQLVAVDALTFDNIDSLRVSPRISVTSHPVEFGVEVSDHAQTLPLTLAVRGRITETPIIPLPAAVELALAFFERQERQLVTITTSRGVFSDMMILQYDWEITQRREIVFDVVMKNIRIAFAVSVLIPPRTPAPPLQAGAASATDAGVQPSSVVPPPPPSSVLGTLASFL